MHNYACAGLVHLHSPAAPPIQLELFFFCRSISLALYKTSRAPLSLLAQEPHKKILIPQGTASHILTPSATFSRRPIDTLIYSYSSLASLDFFSLSFFQPHPIYTSLIGYLLIHIHAHTYIVAFTFFIGLLSLPEYTLIFTYSALSLDI